MTASEEPSDPPSVRQRLGRVLRLVGVLAGLVVLGLVGVVGALQIDGVATWAARTAAGAASSDSLQIRLGRVSLRGLTNVEVTGIESAIGPSADPAFVVSVDTVALGYRILPLFRRHVSVETLRIVGASGSGSLRSGEDAPPPEEDAAGGGWTFGVDRLEVDVREITLALPEAPSDEPWRLSEGRLRGRDLALAEEMTGTLDTLHARFRPPERPEGWGRLAASGSLEADHVVVDGLELTSPESDVRATGRIPLSLAGTAPEGLELDLEIAPLHLADVGPFLPAGMADSVRVRGSAEMRASADTLRLTGALDASVPGRLDFEASVWGPREEPDVDAQVSASGFDAQPWGFLDRPLVADLDMTLGLRSATLQRVHGTLVAELQVEDPSGPLGGRASVNVESEGAEDPWRGGWTLGGMGATAQGSVRVGALERPEWTIDGVLEYASSEAVDADAGFALRSGSGRFEASGVGVDPDSMDARATVELEALRASVGGDGERRAVVVGPGRIGAELSAGLVSGDATLEAAGGSIDLALEGDVSARTGRLTSGTVRDVDVAALVGDTLASRLSADVVGAITSAEPLAGTGRVDVLVATYGPWSLDSATVSASARDGTIDVAMRAAVPDSGRLSARVRALSEGGVFRAVQIDSLGWRHLDARVLAPGAENDSSAVPSTDFSGSGTGRLTRGEEGWSGAVALALLPSVIGTAHLDTGDIDVRLEPGGLEVDASLTSGEGGLRARVEMDGAGEARTLRVPELAFEDLDLGALSEGLAPPTRLQGALTARLDGSSVETATGSLTLDLAASLVDSLAVDTLGLDLDLADGVVQARALAELFSGTVEFEGQSAFRDERPTYTASGRIARPPEDGLVGPVGFARLGLEGEGFELDSARATFWIEVDSGSVANEPVDAASARVGLDRGALTIDTLDVRLPGFELSGRGTLPRSATGLATGDQADGNGGEVRVVAELTRSDLLRALRPEGTLAAGDGTMEVVARGAIDDLRIEGTGRLSALLIDATQVRGLEVDASARRTSAEGWVEAEGTLAMDRLRLPTAPIERVDIEARLEPDDELVVTASAVIDGRRDVAFEARVEERSAPSAVRIEQFAFRADQDEWTLEYPARVSLRDGFSVDSLLISTPDQAIRLGGAVPEEGTLDFRADITDFEISTLSDLLGYPALRGRVSGDVDVSGTAEAPEITARLDSRLTPADVSPADIDVTLEYRERAVGVDGVVLLDSGPSFRADLRLPFHVTLAGEAEGLLEGESMSGSVSAEAFPMAWLQPLVPDDVARDLDGTLEGRAELGGSPESPSLSGVLTLRGGAATLPALGVRYREARARLELDGTRVRVESARVHSGDGSLSATGTITVDHLAEPSYDVQVQADRFEAIRSSAVQATVSGDVGIEGTGMAPRVGGTVAVERAELYLDDLVSGSTADPVVLTDDQWDELARVFGYQRPSDGGRESPLLDVVELDLDVRLGRASWVRQRANPELAIQFSGDMAVTKEPGDSLQLVGGVEAVPERSWVEQFGRRFSIEEGRLTFRGTPAATMVEVRSAFAVPSRENPGEPEVVLTLEVRGTPDALELELSSTPPLEASDMVSYLVTGRPASQSLEGGEGSLTEAGGALALGRVSGAVEAYAKEQVGLDVVEITTDGMNGVTLLAGRYLSPTLYLGIRQPLSLQRSTDDPTQRAPEPEIEAELQAVRWLLLNLRAGARTGVEFYVRSRIAYD